MCLIKAVYVKFSHDALELLLNALKLYLRQILRFNIKDFGIATAFSVCSEKYFYSLKTENKTLMWQNSAFTSFKY